MKHFITLIAVGAFMLQAMPIAAQQDIPLRSIKAVKQGTDLTLLDSITSDSYRKYYQYNEYGYITSVIGYYKEDDSWLLDAFNSYRQEYVFNADGQCLERARYDVDNAGNKTTMTEKATLEVKDGLTWENYYSHRFDGNIHPDATYAYDKWGNMAVKIEYELRDGLDYIKRYKKNEYSGPVNMYKGHIHSWELEFELLLSELDASGKATDLEDLTVGIYKRYEWEQDGNKLYKKVYVAPYDKSIKVKDMEAEVYNEGVYEYTLNEVGTRPVSMIYRDNEDDEQYGFSDAYKWDDKGRLIERSRIYNKSKDEQEVEQYAYADDYAIEYSLQEAIRMLNKDADVYPEDEYSRFGRLSTYSNGGKKFSCSWDAEGHLTKVIETRSSYETEIRFGYNSEGHMAWAIESLGGEGRVYSKEEYLYNQNGIWTRTKLYRGNSWDGPWGDIIITRSSRMEQDKLQISDLIGDMSEGRHDIDHDDEIWNVSGDYYVENGNVVDGSILFSLISKTSIPQNPEYNYTDPLLPLTMEKPVDYLQSIDAWRYRWDMKKNDWVCDYSPVSAERVYEKDGNIVADKYDSNRDIVSTTTYVLDSEGKRVKDLCSNGNNTTYEYLSGTNYLLESVTTNANGERQVSKFYYSKHNYLDPTGVESITGKVDETKSAIYDLQGRRMTRQIGDGIYIINGKKVLR